MDIVTNFLKAISSVTGPLSLLAFIVVALLAALLLVLKSTKGLEKAQELLLKDSSLKSGDFIKIVTRVLLALLFIATLLFTLLFYDYYTNLQKAKSQTGLSCYAETCTERDPKDSGCDKGVDTITSTIVSFPELGEEYKNLKLEMRHSARCNASWVKVPPVIGSTIYLEGKQGKKYVPLLIKDDGIKDPHFTNMLTGEIERRACIGYPGKEPQCTGFIK